jgi:hypothetical protein
LGLSVFEIASGLKFKAQDKYDSFC